MWSKGKTIYDVVIIGVEEGGLYKPKGHTNSSFIDSTIIPCELWHKGVAHVNYKALPIMSKVVTCTAYIQINHEGVSKGCA